MKDALLKYSDTIPKRDDGRLLSSIRESAQAMKNDPDLSEKQKGFNEAISLAKNILVELSGQFIDSRDRTMIHKAIDEIRKLQCVDGDRDLKKLDP